MLGRSIRCMCVLLARSKDYLPRSGTPLDPASQTLTVCIDIPLLKIGDLYYRELFVFSIVW